jgi:FtsZ-binding cell division protein ZapB
MQALIALDLKVSNDQGSCGSDYATGTQNYGGGDQKLGKNSINSWGGKREDFGANKDKELQRDPSLHLPRWAREIQTQLKSLTTEVSTLKQENALLRTEVSTLKQENVLLRTEVSTLKQENALLRTEVSTLKQENVLLRTEVSTLKQENALLRTEVSTLKQENVLQQTQLTTLANQNTELINEISDIRAIYTLRAVSFCK